MDPSLFDPNGRNNDAPYQRNQSGKKRHHSSRKSSRNGSPAPESSSCCDIWVFLPLSLAIFLSAMAFLLYKNHHVKLVYCSQDIVYNPCRKCPDNAACMGGKMTCDTGFKRIGDICVTDQERAMKAMKLARDIGAFIAKQPNEFCNASILISYTILSDKFGNIELFNEAIDRISSSEYEVFYNGEGYISYNPTLNTKCKIHRFYVENKSSVYLQLVSGTIILILLMKFLKRKSIKNKVHDKAKAILNFMDRRSNGEQSNFIAENFRPEPKDPLNKEWKSIMREVEKSPFVSPYSTTEGRLWQYNPPAVKLY